MSRNEETLKAGIDYITPPDIEGKTVILSDTMLGTGGSLISAIKILETKKPKEFLSSRLLLVSQALKIFKNTIRISRFE